MKEHLHEAIFKLCDAIKTSRTIYGVPDDSWVHWEGGSFWSGEAHADCIIRAYVTHNTLMTQLDLATMLGVRVDNHGVKNAIKSLTKGNV